MSLAAPRPRPLRHERGVAALGVAIMLLVAMTAVTFFANRSLMFEQRSSANQYRATRAFEAAEAGLEWATARLNDPRSLDASCQPLGGTGTSFLDRYAATDAGLAFTPAAAARPGCGLGDAALACSCPGAGSAPALRDDAPSFTLELTAVPGDPQSLQLVSRGCSGRGSQCVPGASEPSDASATVHAIVKRLPALRRLPVAAVTAGGPIVVAAGLQVANTDVRTQGYAVHAGGTVSVAPTAITTLAGSPPSLAVVAQDASLSSAASGDAAFAAWFGGTASQFAASAATQRLGNCGTDCAAALQAAHADGHVGFLVQGDLHLDATGWPGSGIGSPERPVLLVVQGRITLRGGPLHGLVYLDAPDAAATVDASVQGALVARDRLALDGAGHLRYDPAVLARLRAQVGVLARVPGSWHDQRCSSDDPAQACQAAH